MKKIDVLALTAKLEEREQTLIEDVTAFDGGVSVIEYLGEKGVDVLEGSHMSRLANRINASKFMPEARCPACLIVLSCIGCQAEFPGLPCSV